MSLFIILIFLTSVFLVRVNGDYNISNNYTQWGSNNISNNSIAWGLKTFDAYYSYLWGLDHFSVNPEGTLVALKFDKYSGAGFRSKLEYGYGVFSIRMKIPSKKTGGIVTNVYLTSAPDNQDPGNHFELDYEFLGTNGTVQTNVYDNDTGNRQQSINLWFDPKQDFHTCEFLWNPYHIVFSIDGIPIREFKNNMAHGVAYPKKPMHIEASIWNADWAGVVDWSHAPFIAYYSGFSLYACTPNGDDISPCGSEKYFWNGPQYRQLDPKKKQLMDSYRRKYMSYDYCWKPSTQKKECSLNN
ncbi:xyloglucan endotransglucosylase/hydrolase protein 3 [Phtheirospermum japonicum]|uniref:Xyloglucan endotransglucosylase/hydrolase protein 3 n=1 Tax=Phtheirospermum japonicum TaxID=374723 RepID=A0A830D4Y1_9LAMI|nr:xyloglucan endotransglucosylase/hydrolase protein 3 [Phtheirospermum japonicum]